MRHFTEEQKARRKVTASAWREKNREKERTRQQTYAADPVKSAKKKVYLAEWAIRNKDREKARKSTPEYKVKAKKYQANYRARNVEKLREARTAYRDRPEVITRKVATKNKTLAPIEPPNRPRPLTCDICNGVSNNGSRLHFDHCHGTGRFRGWLCNRCNMALGLVKDNPETLRTMIDYITRIHTVSLRGYSVRDPHSRQVASR